MTQMEIEDDSSAQRLSTRNDRSSRLSSVNSEANDKRHSLRGRRSSMSVKQIVDGTEITKDVIIGEDMIKINEKNPSLVSVKMTAIDEEKQYLMNYMKKLKNEKEQWDEMLQIYEKNVDIAKSELNKSIVLNPKHAEEVRTEYMGTRNAPSPIEIALAMKLSLQRKAESQISQNQKLKAKITALEDKFHRLQELIEVQQKYLNHENKDILLVQKAECDAILLQIENWAAKHGFSEYLTAI
ncbi:Myb-related protein [Dirofilaria immitis]